MISERDRDFEFDEPLAGGIKSDFGAFDLTGQGVDRLGIDPRYRIETKAENLIWSPVRNIGRELAHPRREFLNLVFRVFAELLDAHILAQSSILLGLQRFFGHGFLLCYKAASGCALEFAEGLGPVVGDDLRTG